MDTISKNFVQINKTNAKTETRQAVTKSIKTIA